MSKTVNDIRNEFLGFFDKNGHEIVPSAPLVPQNDPSVMFTMAGMLPFKNVFTGLESRPYTRATSSQKCVRAGGKHNDLENVGYTARHHTFFEMLGNFSFGDYFKEEAIAYAWELVTKVFGLPAEKLLVTVHTTDEEAADLWKKIAGLPDHKIIRIGTDDNFWRMGDTGPCGPCTEIFYDHGEHIWGGPPGSPDEDGDRFIEIWNVVFMQYEQITPDKRIDLPKPSVDTGMGLERMAATMMGSNNNYDIDIMRALMEHSADLTQVHVDGEMTASHKVIADHLRSASFLMADGVMPSNEGRGYVLRRIMRRGMRHAHLLGAQDPLMYQLFPTLLSKMGEAYPELSRAQSLITQTLETEEKRFKATLDRGLKMLDDETAGLSEGQKLSGAVAFKLYDTYGFPLDLTQDALRGKNLDVDTDGFDTCMAEQKAKARAAWSGSGDAATEVVWYEILEEFGATEFLGYTKTDAEAHAVAIIKDGARVNSLAQGESGFVITNQSPFYAESGGQVGDTGAITAGDTIASVTDTKKILGKLWVHCVTIDKGALTLDDAVSMSVDADRRSAITANHSVTHLLHEALRHVLGDHVSQKGSLQDDRRTRFDVSQPVALTPAQITEVEALVNREIAADTEVATRVMALDDARETGAAALFGEKYEDEVRVVFMGTPDATTDQPFSVELCGGTHVTRTGEIAAFKIISEGALSSGIRRIEAITGARVAEYEAAQQAQAQEDLDRLLTQNTALRTEIVSLGGEAGEAVAPTSQESLLADIKRLQKEISQLRRQNAAQSDDNVEEINGVKFTSRILADFPPKDLKPMADDLKNTLGSGVVVLIASNDGKASIVVGVTSDLSGKINAVDLVRIGAEALGGKGGGGRPDMAQAGGTNPDAAADAVGAIKAVV